MERYAIYLMPDNTLDIIQEFVSGECCRVSEFMEDREKLVTLIESKLEPTSKIMANPYLGFYTKQTLLTNLLRVI